MKKKDPRPTLSPHNIAEQRYDNEIGNQSHAVLCICFRITFIFTKILVSCSYESNDKNKILKSNSSLFSILIE